MNSASPQLTPYVSPHPWRRNLWGALLDTSIYWSFDRTGFERHARSFQELVSAQRPSELHPLRVMVTGANSGIGYACAEALCTLGVEVLMVCRDEQRGARARDELIRALNPSHPPLLITADLHDLTSVERAVEQVQGPLHGLIHNAGLLPADRTLNSVGVEQCVGVHLFGPALLTERLQAQLKEGGAALQESVGRGARVVWLSSGGMYTKPVSLVALKALSDSSAPYDGVSAYAYTKRAQVELAAQLHAQALEEGGLIEHHSAHPGWVYTPGVVTSLPAFTRFTQKRLRTPAQGADTCVWLSASPQALPGAFWFDREARSPHLLGHRPTPEQREALWRFVREGAGLLMLTMLWLLIGLSGALGGAFSRVLGEAYASPALYTLGALDQDLPFSAAERGAGASVVAFNPAGLAWSAEEGGAQTVGLSMTRQALSVRYLPRPRSVNVTSDVYEARPISGEPSPFKPLPTAELGGRGLAEDANEQVYLNLAWQTHLTKRLAVGVYTLLPLHRFELQAPSYPDERAQYFGNQLTFERWGDALEGLSTAAGLAYQPLNILSVGVGVNLATQAIAQSDVFLGDVNYNGVSYVAPRVEVSTSVSPFGSLELRRAWGVHTFSLNVSAHAPESSEVEGEGQVQVWGFPYPEGERALPQRFRQVYRALPWRGRVGVAWREGREGRAETSTSEGAQASERGLALGVGWAQWSGYLNRAGEGVTWSDQWEVSAGGWSALSEGRVGLDVRWRPSPVPEQIGRTSYIDPSQLAAALSLVWPLSEHLSLSAQLQGHRLLPRLDEKDMQALDPVVDEVPTSLNPRTGELMDASEGLQTNNPGYPGYESEGWVWVGQMGLRVAL